MIKSIKTQYTPSLPAIPKRCYNYKEHRQEIYPTNTLPFTTFPRSQSDKTPLCFWSVPPVDDYSLACRIGREYAAHFIQYMKDNPDSVEENTLGHISKSINFNDQSAAKGYWVGFFSHLERFIFRGAQRVSVFGDLDQLNAHYDVIEAEDVSELELES